MRKFLFVLVIICTGVVCSVRADEEWFGGKLPSKLVNASGKRAETSSLLKDKVVAIYFSASWCGTCRMFTPKLAKFYKRAAKKNGIEVVFVSQDKTDSEMKSYMKKYSMPWHAVSFEDEAGKALKKEFKVSRIPTLIVIGKDGKVITRSGVKDVSKLGIKAADSWTSSKLKKDDGKETEKEEKSSSKKTKKSKKSKKSRKDSESE